MPNKNNRLYNETIALAAIVQAATLVADLATKNHISEEYFATSITSIFKIQSNSIEDVFDGKANNIPGLSIGFKTLGNIINKRLASDGNILRYSLEIIALQRRLQRNNQLAATISKRIEKLMPQLEFNSVTDQLIIAALSSIYEDTLSKLGRRIQVTGDRSYLENPYNTHKIRALLLAGVRAAMLWQQVGGKRWHVIFYKKQIALNAKNLLLS